MNTDQATLLAAGSELITLGTDIVEGRLADAVDATHKLLAILVTMIPVDELKASLTTGDKMTADFTVDVAEDVKLQSEADE